MEHQPQHRSGQKTDEQHRGETLRWRIARQTDHHLRQALAIVPAYRKDCGELDDDLEHLAGLVVIAKQIAEDDQVASGRDRQELGEAFDDAQNRGFKQQSNIHKFEALICMPN